MAVLIIAQESDAHARATERQVRLLGGQAIIADLSLFPQQQLLRVRYSCCGDRRFELAISDRTHDLGDVGSIWWRRPQQPRVSDELADPTHRLFALNECSEALTGLWHALDAFWVNDPAKDHVAHRKIMQLRRAQECGFKVPDTLITNDPAAARVFIDRHGYRSVVYKAFSAFEQAWRETRTIRAEELELIDQVSYSPVIFQEYVEALYDVRVTVVGDRIFAAAIHSQETSYPTDFRMDMANARITAVELPPEVDTQVLRYMRDLGLQYGAIDMRLRPDGEYVFLEINPAGQWLFVEDATGQPIAAALARLLVEHDAASAERTAEAVATAFGASP